MYNAVRSGCVCACVFLCLCVWRARLCTEGARCLQFDRAAHGSTTTTTGQSGPCQILLLKVTQKKKKKADKGKKTPEENSFLQKDGSPADGFFPSGAGSWLSKKNANSPPSIKCYFEQVFRIRILLEWVIWDARSHVLNALTKWLLTRWGNMCFSNLPW